MSSSSFLMTSLYNKQTKTGISVLAMLYMQALLLAQESAIATDADKNAAEVAYGD